MKLGLGKVPPLQLSVTVVNRLYILKVSKLPKDEKPEAKQMKRLRDDADEEAFPSKVSPLNITTIT